MNSKIKLALKILFVVGLLYFLAKKGFISLAETKHALLQWKYSLPAFAVIMLNSFLGVVRWNLLLKAHDIRLPFWRVFQLTFVGLFFNIALPGAVSGDFVKAFYVGKEAGGQKTKAFGSILFDRVAGLSALSLISAGAFLIAMAQFSDSRVLRALQFFVTTGAVVVIAFYAYLFLVREHHDPLLKLLRGIRAKFPKLSIFSDVYESLRHYHSHRWTVIQVLLISIFLQVAAGWATLQFAYAMGETQLALIPVYIVFPIGLLITAIPVLPAGVGTGHAAFLYLFGLLGSQRGADVFSLYALTQIITGAIGGLIYLRFRTAEPAPVLTEA